MKKSISLQFTFILIFLTSILTAFLLKNNATTDCPKEKYYSLDFLNSQFYQGWKLMHSDANKMNCRLALPYFVKSLNNNVLIEISSLYYEYCSFPEKTNIMEQSSIYQAKNLNHKISEDEFKWMINLALCESVVEQYAIGNMLYHGFIINQDIKQGLYFLTLAAKKNHILAQIQLAKALEEQGKENLAKKWRKKTKKILAKY